MIITKDQLLDTLSAHGVVNVIVCYDGQGDSGMIEDVKISPADGPLSAPLLLDIDRHRLACGIVDEPYYAYTIQELVESFIYDKLGASQPGWEINDGSYGTVAIFVADRVISWDHYTRWTTSDHVEIEV